MLFHVRLLAAILAMFTKALLVKIKLTKNILACIFGLLTNPNYEGIDGALVTAIGDIFQISVVAVRTEYGH